MLTKEEAGALLGGARKEMPESPQTPEEILEAMKAAAGNFYRDAIKTNNHPFIEFTGLINEYIKICGENLIQGVDFTKTSVHCPAEKLKIQPHELDYINTKLQCIFPDFQLVVIETKETKMVEPYFKKMNEFAAEMAALRESEPVILTVPRWVMFSIIPTLQLASWHPEILQNSIALQVARQWQKLMFPADRFPAAAELLELGWGRECDREDC